MNLRIKPVVGWVTNQFVELAGKVGIIYTIRRRKSLDKIQGCINKIYFVFSLNRFIKRIEIDNRINKKSININNNKLKMRNKEVILTKLERLEAEIKLVGYNVRTANQDVAYEKVGKVLEDLSDIRTLINTEHQA
jgi:hypothetical protein